MTWIVWLVVAFGGVVLIVWGAETFAEHLAAASVRLGASAFGLAVLLAGAEPEELATVVTASLRDAPGIALGDIIGANIAICLVALGIGAWLTPVPFGAAVRPYAIAGLPLGILAATMAWDGRVGRLEGAVLVAAYLVFIAVLWLRERHPPALGETGELTDAMDGTQGRRVGRELALVVVGVAAMAVGAVALVDGIRQLSGIEETQTRLGLAVVGFATAFELVVLAWSSARRGITEAVVAGVVGSFAYNVTMSLGAGGLVSPIELFDASTLHIAWVVMLGALVAVLILSRRGQLRRSHGSVLLALYPIAIAVALTGV
jgi:cation:H+ antiporter